MNNRAYAVDILRGLAIVGMVLSGYIAWNPDLPAWLFHAQLPPPSFVFDASVAGNYVGGPRLPLFPLFDGRGLSALAGPQAEPRRPAPADRRLDPQTGPAARLFRRCARQHGAVDARRRVAASRRERPCDDDGLGRLFRDVRADSRLHPAAERVAQRRRALRSSRSLWACTGGWASG